jgi:antitoxin component of MazEF toxin-antitoxin module
MTARVKKMGNSQGIVFDTAFMNLSGLKVGDRLDLTVVPDIGAIILLPLRGRGPRPNEISAILRKTMQDYHGTLKRLA